MSDIKQEALKTVYSTYVSDNRNNVYIKIDDYEGLYNDYSYGKQLDLDTDVYDYIDNQTENIVITFPLTLHFVVNDEVDVEKLEHCLRQHYLFELNSIEKKLAFNKFKSISLIIVGVAVLALYCALTIVLEDPMFLEIISIGSWFLLWEGFDTWVLARRELKIDYRRIKRLYECDVMIDSVE